MPLNAHSGIAGKGPAGPSDESLALRSRQGDMAAFEALARRYQDRIYTYAIRIVGRVQDAEDLTQEVLLRAFGSLARFDPRQRFAPWLFGIAAHVCRDCLRQRRRRREQVTEAVEPAAGGATPAHEAQAAEERQRVLEAVESLPRKYREVIVLHYLEGMGYEEVAASLAIRPAAARRRALRAREMLRRHLE